MPGEGGAALGVWTGNLVRSSFPLGPSQSTLLCRELLLATLCRHREPGPELPWLGANQALKGLLVSWPRAAGVLGAEGSVAWRPRRQRQKPGNPRHPICLGPVRRAALSPHTTPSYQMQALLFQNLLTRWEVGLALLGTFWWAVSSKLLFLRSLILISYEIDA